VVTPYRATISVFNEHGRLVEEVVTDDEGLFSVHLKPGNYTLVPHNPELPQTSPSAYPVDLIVGFKHFTYVSIVYSAGGI
jgi:uncharacterized surface anchored protein